MWANVYDAVPTLILHRFSVPCLPDSWETEQHFYHQSWYSKIWHTSDCKTRTVYEVHGDNFFFLLSSKVIKKPLQLMDLRAQQNKLIGTHSADWTVWNSLWAYKLYKTTHVLVECCISHKGTCANTFKRAQMNILLWNTWNNWRNVILFRWWIHKIIFNNQPFDCLAC